MTVPDVAACIAAVGILERSGQRVDQLWDNARYFQAKMKALGFDLGVTQTPISPVILGDEKVTQLFSKKLFQREVFASPITFPTVPRGRARIRVMISAAHSRADLDYGIEQFKLVGHEVGILV